MYHSNFSTHATARMGQRGIPNALVGLILSEHDRCVPVGHGCECLSISRREVQSLKGAYSSQLLDAAPRHAVLLGRKDRIVTVLKLHAGMRGRIYRKGR